MAKILAKLKNFFKKEINIKYFFITLFIILLIILFTMIIINKLEIRVGIWDIDRVTDDYVIVSKKVNFEQEIIGGVFVKNNPHLILPFDPHLEMIKFAAGDYEGVELPSYHKNLVFGVTRLESIMRITLRMSTIGVLSIFIFILFIKLIRAIKLTYKTYDIANTAFGKRLSFEFNDFLTALMFPLDKTIFKIFDKKKFLKSNFVKEVKKEFKDFQLECLRLEERWDILITIILNFIALKLEALYYYFTIFLLKIKKLWEWFKDIFK